MRSWLRRTLALAVVTCAGGCPPPAVYQSADTLEPGQWQIGGGLGVGTLRDVEQDTRLPTGDVQVFARRGVAPNLDVGLRVYTPGIEASVKWRFHREDWSIAVMPGLAAMVTKENALTTRAFHSFATVPLLASRRLSTRWTVTLGPKATTGLYWSDASDPTFGMQLGGLAMFAVRLGNFSLMPEVDLSRTIAGTVPIDGWIAHLGVGLAWQP